MNRRNVLKGIFAGIATAFLGKLNLSPKIPAGYPGDFNPKLHADRTLIRPNALGGGFSQGDDGEWEFRVQGENFNLTPYDGKIAMVFYHQEVLSDTQIQALYEKTRPMFEPVKANNAL
jgi:hypothetical protein